MTHADEVFGEVVTPSAAGQIVRAEVDIQISTARQYPRSLKTFRDRCLDMVMSSGEVAESCTYAVPRGKDFIVGPSVRLAEIVVSSWCNCRAGARIIEVGADAIVAQGAFHDLETNVAVTTEVRRSIRKKAKRGQDKGDRYTEDMISQVSNAACSVAFRNAVFKGIPAAIVEPIWRSSQKHAAGDGSLDDVRRACFEKFSLVGASEADVLALARVDAVEDLRLETMRVLRGIYQAIEQGETTLDAALAEVKPKPSKPTVDDETREKVRSRRQQDQKDAESKAAEESKEGDGPKKGGDPKEDDDGGDGEEGGGDDTPPFNTDKPGDKPATKSVKLKA